MKGSKVPYCLQLSKQLPLSSPHLFSLAHNLPEHLLISPPQGAPPPLYTREESVFTNNLICPGQIKDSAQEGTDTKHIMENLPRCLMDSGTV
jgi:hypothetical protein